MSRTSPRSNNDFVKSPKMVRFEWAAEEGVFKYWDGEETQKIASLEFTILDRASSITGWSEANKCSVYSNYVKSSKTQEFVVKESRNNQIVLKGLYSDIKGEFNFTENIFAMVNMQGTWVLGQIQFIRSSLSAWTNFTSESPIYNLYDKIITTGKSDLQTKGRAKYYFPTFEVSDIDDNLSELADEADSMELQPWLSQFEPKKSEVEV